MLAIGTGDWFFVAWNTCRDGMARAASPWAGNGRGSCVEPEGVRAIERERTGGDFDSGTAAVATRPAPSSTPRRSPTTRCMRSEALRRPRRWCTATSASGVELVGVQEHRARLRALRGPDRPLELEEVHEPSRPCEAHAELALEHRRRAELAPHHQLASLAQQLLVVLVARNPASRRHVRVDVLGDHRLADAALASPGGHDGADLLF